METKLVNPFIEKLAGDTAPIGSWVMSGSNLVAEAMGKTGFDWLLIDGEHTPLSLPQTVGIMQAIGCTSAATVLRIPWNDPVVIKQVLDAGAQTLMIPFVQNPQEAEKAVKAMKYPPDGTRGVAVVTRGNHFGTIKGYAQKANNYTGCIVQIETPEAAEQLEAIAAVTGVDALFIGPGDMAASMGHLGDTDHPDVQKMLQSLAQRANQVGKPVGIVGQNSQAVTRFLEYGYNYVAVGSDIGMLTRIANEQLSALRNESATLDTSGY